MKYQLLVTLSDGTSLRQDENEKKRSNNVESGHSNLSTISFLKATGKSKNKNKNKNKKSREKNSKKVRHSALIVQK